METGISQSNVKEMFRIRGLKEAVDILEDLSTADQKKMLLNVMRKAVRPIPREARVNLGGYSQRVAKSLRTWQPRGSSSNDNPRLFVGVKSNFRGYKDKTDPWFAPMIEHGTTGIKKKTRAESSMRDDEHSFFRIRSSQTRKGERFRKDMPAMPFFQPAVDRNQDRVSQVLIDDISTELMKRVERKKR